MHLAKGKHGMWFTRSAGRKGLEDNIPVVQIYSGQIKTARIFVPEKLFNPVASWVRKSGRRLCPKLSSLRAHRNSAKSCAFIIISKEKINIYI